jgi:hypothetical protein
VRNPANTPDEVDRAVLHELEEAHSIGVALPTEVVRRVGGGELRFYRPILVAEPCLGCHGPPEDLAPDVRDVLRARYPHDRAFGYRVGDVRGAVRVRIPVSALAASSGSGPD